MVACACMVGFSACDSFLDESPKDQLTTNSYYQSEAHAQQNVNYLYRTGVPARLTSTGAYQGSIAQIQGALTGYFTNTYTKNAFHHRWLFHQIHKRAFLHRARNYKNSPDLDR